MSLFYHQTSKGVWINKGKTDARKKEKINMIL
jgi:hypothetical protein